MIKYVDKARIVVLAMVAVNTVVITVVLVSGGKLMRIHVIHEDYFMDNVENPHLPILLAIFALTAGMASVATLITGLHHVRAWSSMSRAAAQASAWISFMLAVLAMSYAISELGSENVSYLLPELSILRITVIVLAPTHLLHNLGLYISPQTRRNLDPSQADDQING